MNGLNEEESSWSGTSLDAPRGCLEIYSFGASRLRDLAHFYRSCERVFAPACDCIWTRSDFFTSAFLFSVASLPCRASSDCYIASCLAASSAYICY